MSKIIAVLLISLTVGVADAKPTHEVSVSSGAHAPVHRTVQTVVHKPVTHVSTKAVTIDTRRVVHTTHKPIGVVSALHRPSKVTNVTYYARGKCKPCISRTDLKRSVLSAAKRYDVSDILITAVISQESAFKPNAKLGRQVGLMQVDLGWHHSKFHDNPYKPTVNIMVGTSILHDCLKRKHGQVTKALQCYNGGGDPRYASKVLSASYQVKALL
jgi:hypothetical protein